MFVKRELALMICLVNQKIRFPTLVSFFFFFGLELAILSRIMLAIFVKCSIGQ